MNNKLIGICVGHSRTINGRVEGGASSWDGHEYEWHFNRDLAKRIKSFLSAYNVNSVMYDKYEGVGYSQAQKMLATSLKSRGVTHAIELHFNSAGPAAHGHEVLFWHASANGKALALSIEKSLSAHFKTPARGAKGLTSADRGAEFVRGTHCPAVIVEPFFGSSKEDWQAVAERPDELAKAIAEGIVAAISA
jgi:N-acetylmuramoyl-L-alanine amidase